MHDRPGNINIFILHSKRDRELKRELQDHLSLLERLGYVDIWHEDLIEPGEDRRAEISEYLLKSHIILLLISANFFSCECYDEYSDEIRAAYERQRKGDVKIIPVILRACDWQLDILASLNPLPRDGHPVSDVAHWDSPDKAFKEITVELRKMIHELKKAWSVVKNKVEKSKQVIEKSISSNTILNDLESHISEEIDAVATKMEELVGTVTAHESELIISDGESEVVELLTHFLSMLMRSNKETAITEFRKIGHASLFHDASTYNAFLKTEFHKALDRAKLYSIPVKILQSKFSGRSVIRYGGIKEVGKEVIYTLARNQTYGSFPGQIRVFFPADGSSAKISKLSL